LYGTLGPLYTKALRIQKIFILTLIRLTQLWWLLWFSCLLALFMFLSFFSSTCLWMWWTSPFPPFTLQRRKTLYICYKKKASMGTHPQEVQGK
jgi:hypothetical protein